MGKNSLKTTKNVAEEIQNVQIYPSTERVECNDKFTKVIFKRTYNGTNEEYGIIEKNNRTKGKPKTPDKVFTKYSISTSDGREVSFDEFDRAIFGAVISEQKAGNLYTDVNIIYRFVTGKVGQADVGICPTTNQRTLIKASLKKLMGTIVNFKNLEESLNELGYLDDVKNFKLKESSILPACTLDVRINGQFVEDVVYFDRKSPLLEIAEQKKQILRYPAELLDIPKQNNTPLVIALKNYVLRRVAEIKANKMTPTITFDDVFQKCHLTNATRHKQFDARTTILQLFENLKEKNFIESYEQIKHGVSVHGVKISCKKS